MTLVRTASGDGTLPAAGAVRAYLCKGIFLFPTTSYSLVTKIGCNLGALNKVGYSNPLSSGFICGSNSLAPCLCTAHCAVGRGRQNITSTKTWAPAKRVLT